MGVLIDTDLLVDLERGIRDDAVDGLIGEEDRAISVVTVSELLQGVHRSSGARRAQRSAFVEHLLSGLPSIPITESVARAHSVAWAQLAGRGTPIGAHDLWIGATAIAHGLGIVTRNAGEFSRVPGLRVIAAA